MNSILEAVQFVVGNAQAVHINQVALEETVASFEVAHMKYWLKDIDFDFLGNDDHAIMTFLFLNASLCFCFWGEPKWTLLLDGAGYDGSVGLFMALRETIRKNKKALEWEFWRDISYEGFTQIFAGRGTIPFLQERWHIAQEIAEVLLTQFDGKVENLILAAAGSAQSLLRIIVTHFPSFRDESMYKGHLIPFYKRAQLFIGDIWYFWDGKGIVAMHDIDTLTAFADYKIPQALRHLGILEYVDSLASVIDEKRELAHDSPEEVEIRAATIWSIESMRQLLQKTVPAITTQMVNDYFFLMSKRLDNPKPYHRSRNTFY